MPFLLQKRRHRRAWFGISSLGAVAALLMVSIAPVAAQGFFEQLFNLGGTRPPASSPEPFPRSQSTRGHASPASPFFGLPSTRLDAEDGGRQAPMSHGTYRTVCVRMCDGFYIPISFATTHESFYQDQAKCRSTCGDEARLFVHRNPGEGMESATDLSGRGYAQLPTAFRFRKAMVAGCMCRPPPWSDAELARHRAYAEVDAHAAPPAAIPIVVTEQSPKARTDGVEKAPTLLRDAKADRSADAFFAEPRKKPATAPRKGASPSRTRYAEVRQPGEQGPFAGLAEAFGLGGPPVRVRRP